MNRFKAKFRDGFGNRVARHFDKYCQFVNPVNFDVIEDIYKQMFTKREWVSLCRLLETTKGRSCLRRDLSFDMYLPAQTPKQQRTKLGRNHVSFIFPDKIRRPGLEMEFDDLPAEAQAAIEPWIRKALALKKLRRALWMRCDRLLNCGWEYQYDTGKEGPTPGMGCNTPGQVYRVWPELLPYLPPEAISKVRNSSTKSPLPKTIMDFGTVGQFRCEEPWSHPSSTYGEDEVPYTEEEMAQEKRMFDALSHILIQMSLMKDVEHIETYPTLS